jgi:methionine-rich copper-binding protein CopC
MAKLHRQLCTVLAILASAVLAHAQIVPTGPPSHAGNTPDAVAYLFPEQVTVAAGKPSPVTLHFRVASGLHINSHTPSDGSYIPTAFSIPASSGVRLDASSYPPGVVIALAIDPKTRLSVYTGEFVVQARIVSTPGNHLVQGKLRYQACDNNECMPPRTITVPIDVIGR